MYDVIYATAGAKPMKKFNVILARGLAGAVYSTGLDILALELRKLPQVDYVIVVQYTDWRRVGDRIKNFRDDTVLVGHSFGVTAMLGAARRASSKFFPLAIMFDPSQWWRQSFSLWGSGGKTVPINVKRVVNFYQGGGMIGRQELARDDGTEHEILNQLVPDTSHADIDDRRDLHEKAITEIKAPTTS